MTDKERIKRELAFLIGSDDRFTGEFHPRPDSSITDKIYYDYKGCSAPGSEFYVLLDGKGNTAGAFNLFYDELSNPSLSFSFIHPAYRKSKEVKKEFWKSVWKVCKSDYFCVGIRDKNPRAQRWFEKNGGLHLFDALDPNNPGQKLKMLYFRRGVDKWPS